jgi:hypothetical protein
VIWWVKWKWWIWKENILWKALNTLIPSLFYLDESRMIWVVRSQSVTVEMLASLKERAILKTIGKKP